MSWWNDIVERAPLADLATRVGAGGTTDVHGALGSSPTLVSLAAQLADRPLLHVVAHLDDADEIVDELAGFGVEAVRLPALEALPGETSLSMDLLAERLALVRRILEDCVPPVVVAPIQALMQKVPAPERIGDLQCRVAVGDALDLEAFVRWLDGAGYRRTPSLDGPLEFAVRGGIVDVFPPGATPVRVDFLGDEVESICEIDLDSMGSDRLLRRVEIVGATVESVQNDDESVLFSDLATPGWISVLSEVGEIDEQARSYFERVIDARGIAGPQEVLRSLAAVSTGMVEIRGLGGGNDGAGASGAIRLPAEPLPVFDESVSTALGELATVGRDHRVVVLCQNAGETQRMHELVEEHDAGAVEVVEQYLHRGFIWRGAGGGGLVVVPYHELVHRYQTRRRVRAISSGGRALDTFIDLQPGDHVVHRDHGIARFAGLQTMRGASGGAPEEFLTLEFSGAAKLHVPASKIELVQKYIGAFKGRPELSTLGGKRWRGQKEKVEEAVRDMASEMLRIQALRESMPGIRFPADTAWQTEFEAEFPFVETDDQVAAIEATKRDMSDPRPMDRLVCGDVGFGKTEVAIRAAFKAAEFSRQVAVLVPTTVLAEQHERTFRERFAGYPFRIESISRFKTRKEQTAVLDAVARGRVDVVIGTHRLLSKDVRFADLGLVVIDEEQRFGVDHKHRLLEFRATADVMTMSATPIPRTLHMAMLGLRDISALSTPPLDRRAIVTEVLSYDPHRIRSAISRELAREGQVFFVHNRVHDIHEVADEVRRLADGARVILGHGQMPARELESVMLKFVRHEADVLVCTTIIESGIDIPSANTMLINHAHMFGLSELHQLRGRVGRYKHRAYCYLMLAPDRTVNPTAMKRLRALETFSMLGAGFKIALRDLEIRGAGNLLGAEQSGHIAAVGYEMYCRMLEHAVTRLKHESVETALDTTIDIGISGSLPKGYIPSDTRRMDAYRRISRAETPAEIDAVRADLVSAYGDLPRSAEVLVELAEIRIGAARSGVVALVRRDDDIVFRTNRPNDVLAAMDGAPGTVRRVIPPDAGTREVPQIYYRPTRASMEDATLLTILRRRLVTERDGAVPSSTPRQAMEKVKR